MKKLGEATILASKLEPFVATVSEEEKREFQHDPHIYVFRRESLKNLSLAFMK